MNAEPASMVIASGQPPTLQPTLSFMGYGFFEIGTPFEAVGSHWLIVQRTLSKMKSGYRHNYEAIRVHGT